MNLLCTLREGSKGNRRFPLFPLCSLFPIEVVHHILDYDGRIKYRNGKYMKQIAQDDDRYTMLENMPQITKTSIRTRKDTLMIIYSSQENSFTYCTKCIDDSDTIEEPMTTMGDHTSTYHFTKDCIRYSWTFIKYTSLPT